MKNVKNLLINISKPKGGAIAYIDYFQTAQPHIYNTQEKYHEK